MSEGKRLRTGLKELITLYNELDCASRQMERGKPLLRYEQKMKRVRISNLRLGTFHCASSRRGDSNIIMKRNDVVVPLREAFVVMLTASIIEIVTSAACLDKI
jgi:hypothetical protein